FSAGIVLAELLLARPLFAGAREMEVLVKIRDADLTVLDRYARQLPTEIVAVLRRTLARRPEDRFPTTRAYVEALEEVVRRKRLNVTPAVLVEWLYRMGLIRAAGTSGEHSIGEMPAAAAVGMGRPAKEAPRNVKASGSRLVAEPVVEVEDLPPTDAA